MANTNRVSSADALALISATDANGRIDPVAFEAQQLIFTNQKIGGIDAKGLVNSMVSTTAYAPNNNDAMIDAITQRLNKNDARRFGEALDERGLRDNPIESMGRDIGQKFGRGWDDLTQFRDRVDKSISDGMSNKVQSFDKDFRDQDNSYAERVLAGSGKAAVEYGQFRYGDLTGTPKHAIEMLSETVDLAKMAYRFSTDENYRGILIGIAKVYAADSLEDPRKPARDAANAAVGMWKEWEQGFETAKKQGKDAQYLGESGGAAALEALTVIVPFSKLGKFSKVANALDNITPDNPGVLNDIIGEATRHLDRKVEVPQNRPDAPSKPDGRPTAEATEKPDTPNENTSELREQGAKGILKHATRMARHEGVLEELIIRSKPGEVDAMLRQGSFTPQELGQMVRSEKPALGEKLFQNVSFNDALDATTKGVDIPNLSKRHTGDIAEAIMTHKWVKEGYTDIHSIKNNSEHGNDLVGRRPGNQELEFMEVKGSAHGKAKAQTGDPDKTISNWIEKAVDGKGLWDPERTPPGVQSIAKAFQDEVSKGDFNSTWAKVNLKRDPKTGELDHDAVLEKWSAPDERKAQRKTESKSGNASKSGDDETPDQAPAKKSAELSPKDSLGLETIMAAVRKDGRWDEEQSKNIAAASLLEHASDSVQKRIDSVRLNDRGIVFTVYSLDQEKGPHLHSRVNGHEVAQLPAEQSLHQTVQVRQQQQEQALAQQQNQNRGGPQIG